MIFIASKNREVCTPLFETTKMGGGLLGKEKGPKHGFVTKVIFDFITECLANVVNSLV